MHGVLFVLKFLSWSYFEDYVSFTRCDVSTVVFGGHVECRVPSGGRWADGNLNDNALLLSLQQYKSVKL